MHPKNVSDVFSGHFVENRLDVRLGIWQTFSPDHSFEDLICVGLSLIIDDTWAIDQINSFGERDVLPDFGFTWNRCNFAAILFHERVDHR